MALILDRAARAAVMRRQSCGKDATIDLSAERMPRGGYTVAARWGSPAPGTERHVVRVGDAVVTVDERLTRYLTWRNITVSAEHLGPFEYPVPADPLLLFHVAAWERAHPGLTCSAA